MAPAGDEPRRSVDNYQENEQQEVDWHTFVVSLEAARFVNDGYVQEICVVYYESPVEFFWYHLGIIFLILIKLISIVTIGHPYSSS